MQLKVPIDQGFYLSENSQLSESILLNMYVSEGMLKRLYQLEIIEDISDVLGIHFSYYNNGTYLIVTKNQWLIYDGKINPSKVYDYKYSGRPVRFSENKNNEIIVVDGLSAYVFKLDPSSQNRITQLGTAQGFDVEQPQDTIVLDTRAIIVGINSWTISSVNNALVYNGNDVRVIDASLGNAVGCGSYNNDLFIFGQNGIQRWVSSSGATSYNFPYTIDDSFKKQYGAISASTIQYNNDQLIFVSSDFHIRSINSSGLTTLTNNAIAQYISNNIPDSIQGSFVYYNSNYFYSLSLADQSLVYCFTTEKFSLSDVIVNYASNNIVNDRIVASSQGLYKVGNNFTSGLCELSFSSIDINELLSENSTASSQMYFLINQIILTIASGESHIDGDEILALRLSRDNKNYSNALIKKMPVTGDYNSKMMWSVGVSFNRFSIKLSYYGQQDLTIEALDLTMGE